MSAPRILVVGCGYLGLEVARLFHLEGWEVIGCTRSGELAEGAERVEFTIRACDVSEREEVKRLADLENLDAVVHCASSSRGGADQYRRVYLEGAQNLAEVLTPKLLLFTSSTSVYAQTDGEWVSEESSAKPDRETGCILRETEELVCAGGGTAIRVAGIYGPARSVLLKKFFSGEAVIEGDGARWINQAHRDDVATAIWRLVTHRAHGIFNVADNTPISQRELYARLAERFERPLPPRGSIDPHRKRGWTHKRVSNAKLRSLGWKPVYPSFFDALENDPRLLAGFAV